MNRSQSRIMKISKLQIEKRIEKLKRRMNSLYIEIMAAQDALKMFEPPKEEVVVVPSEPVNDFSLAAQTEGQIQAAVQDVIKGE